MSGVAPMTAERTLADVLGDAVPARHAGLAVGDICLDSRRSTPGSLFLACAGGRSHGLAHLADAEARGAAAVAYEPAPGLAPPAGRIPVFPVPGLGERLGAIADGFFGRPSAQLKVIGVTGTNGKTTCTHLIAGALERGGLPAGLIGTLGRGRPGRLDHQGLTTPDVVEVHRGLAELGRAGVGHVAMEVSSHALEQGRVAGVRFDLAVFTNLTRDHLDYHGSMEAYGRSKARLFTRPGLRCAVINCGDGFGADLIGQLPPGVESVAIGGPLAPRATRRLELRGLQAGPDGLVLEFDGSWGALRVHSRLWGRFNAENLALALGAVMALGLDPEDAGVAVGEVPAPPGRMEPFRSLRPGPLVIVDYAHTPDALAKALEAVRAHAGGRVWCVFGCGGERDPGKRPLMGEVANRLADVILLTDDNPRGEDGDRIVADIARGMDRQPRVERDRERAIEQAVSQAREGDVVLVAGKGHEDYQMVGAERRALSDRDIVASLLGVRS